MVGIGFGVFALGIGDGEAGLDGVEFVAADAAVEDFILAGGGVEVPFVLVVFGEGDGHGPFVVADVEGDGAVVVGGEIVLSVVGVEEFVEAMLHFDGIAGEDDLIAGGTEDVARLVLVVGAE